MFFIPDAGRSALLVAILALFFFPPAAHGTSGNVPIDSVLYPSLDRLTSVGLLRSHLSGTRPISWEEVHRLLDEARESLRVMEGEGRTAPPGVKRDLLNLEAAIYRRFTGAARTGSGAAYTAVHDPEAAVEGLWGDPSPIPGIKASRHALLYNNEGIEPDEGGTFSLTGELEGDLGPLHLQLFPRLTSAAGDNRFLHRGSLKAGELFGLELSVGRESLWWGQGSHGGLYLTANAAPLPMVHLSTPHPAVLPWIFRHLGPCRFEFFISRLEENRAVPEPYFVGMRTNIRPFYALELGFSATAMTGGEGRPHVSLGDFFDVFFGENDTVDDRSNKIAGLDFRLNLGGWQLYGEFGGEDEAGGVPSKMAGLVGVYLPEAWPALDVRIEYADLAYTEEIARVWYRHGTYTDGYTYDGRLLGHHVGGGGRDLFTEVTYRTGNSGRARIALDFEQRGLHLQPAVERHAQVSAGWDGPLGSGERGWRLGIEAALDQVTNAGYLKGEEEINGYVRVGVEGGI